MNDAELDARLKAAREPRLAAEYQAEFPQQVLARLRSAPTRRIPARQPWWPRLAWAMATAACVFMAFAMGYWHGQVDTKKLTAQDSLASLKLIRETQAIFPNRVRAIVQDEHGLNLVLSDRDDVPASSPLYIRISDGKKSTSLVTFSGQEIQVAGQKITVLADAHGGIILTGDQFVWSNTERMAAGNHLKIEAKNLGAMAM